MTVAIRKSPVKALATTLAVGVVAAAVSSCGAQATASAPSRCALMPDAIGLYVGNPVTQMGYEIGEVTAIVPQGTAVRVDFALTVNRQLPEDVRAVIRSPSIVADRALEMVGNYTGGPELTSDACVPLDRSFSPKTISQVIGSADEFLDAISADGSTNIADTISGIDRLAQNNGAGAAQLLRSSSALLDSPDQAIGDLGSITRNLAQLTTTLTELRDPVKQILLDAQQTTPDLITALDGGARMGGYHEMSNFGPLGEVVAVLETRMGDETQITLDTLSALIRKTTPHANAISDLFTPVPWWINTFANHFNNRQFHTFNIAYRPPMFRVPTHNGLALCGMMNASTPGSCADINGVPYAVDVALLQYALTEAARK
ncbi:MlaD family protein [Mycolicibacterium parafortuitum]